MQGLKFKWSVRRCVARRRVALDELIVTPPENKCHCVRVTLTVINNPCQTCMAVALHFLSALTV